MSEEPFSETGRIRRLFKYLLVAALLQPVWAILLSALGGDYSPLSSVQWLVNCSHGACLDGFLVIETQSPSLSQTTFTNLPSESLQNFPALIGSRLNEEAEGFYRVAYGGMVFATTGTMKPDFLPLSSDLRMWLNLKSDNGRVYDLKRLTSEVNSTSFRLERIKWRVISYREPIQVVIAVVVIFLL